MDLKLEPMNDLDVDGDGQITINDIKHIWQSKTFWINLLAIVSLIAQAKFGYVIDPATQAEILAFINVVLRRYTSSAVHPIIKRS